MFSHWDIVCFCTIKTLYKKTLNKNILVETTSLKQKEQKTPNPYVSHTEALNPLKR